MKYMIDTEAYQELTSDHCPLADNYNAVRSLLQELLKQKAINPDQHKNDAPQVWYFGIGASTFHTQSTQGKTDKGNKVSLLHPPFCRSQVHH